MFNHDKIVYGVLGGYTQGCEREKKQKEEITYELKSIIPTREALDEMLEIAATFRNEKH